MERLQFKKVINAPVEKVYRAMLGLDNKADYEYWASAFDPSSTYEGDWTTRSKMYFIGTDDKGRKGGMISRVSVHAPAEFVSLRNEGFIDGDDEITTGEEVEGWIGTHENYRFREEQGRTTVTVDLDAVDDHVRFFKDAYPVGLDRLKRLVEK